MAPCSIFVGGRRIPPPEPDRRFAHDLSRKVWDVDPFMLGWALRPVDPKSDSRAPLPRAESGTGFVSVWARRPTDPQIARIVSG